MGRRRRKPTVIKEVTVEKMAAEGKALVRHNGKVVFVEDAIPNDVIDIFVTKKKKDYAIGRIDKLHQASPQRIEPFCTHFGTCGGCKWQFVSYEQQLAYKQHMVAEAFQRIGKLPEHDILPILGADPTTYYRNKMEFTFSNRKWLTLAQIQDETAEYDRNAVGFHVKGMYDRIVDIEHCYLQAEPANLIRNEIREFAKAHGISFYDIKAHEGFLRNLIIRSSTLGETMVILSIGKEDVKQRTALLEHLVNKFPQITSLHYVINPKKNDTINDLEVVTFHGKGFIVEKLGSLTYKISPKSFFQTNSYQAVTLYDTIKKVANLQGDEVVYDLYCGTGSIGIYVANNCKKVIGVEEIPAAIQDANYNAQLNGLTNTTFYAGDAKEILTPEFFEQNGQPDVLITDPPRAGMHKEVVAQILQIAPKRLIYVSCNPVTQARDLQALCEQYDLQTIQPVDMFPHTYHVENVVSLTLKE